jgi:hypothetical protein
MAETPPRGGGKGSVKLPVIGDVKTPWIWFATALVVGIVGYAYWMRARGAEAPGEVLPEDIPQDRQPPPTVVGAEDFDTGEVRAIINTNPEWYTAAVEYLVGTGGFDFTFTTVTLGKFLARRELTEAEANLVQAAKGAVGEPPQGGPWPIIRAQPATPSTSQPPKPLVGWHGTRLTAPITLIELARRYARYPNLPNSVEGTKRQILTRNPFLVARRLNRNSSVIPKGWIIIVPTPERLSA